MLERVHPHFDGRGVLVLDINLGCRIFAHQHHGQTGNDAVVGFQLGHFRGHLGAHACGEGFAVDHFGCHVTSPAV